MEYCENNVGKGCKAETNKSESAAVEGYRMNADYEVRGELIDLFECISLKSKAERFFCTRLTISDIDTAGMIREPQRNVAILLVIKPSGHRFLFAVSPSIR